MKKIFRKAAAIGMLGTALAFAGCTMPTDGSSSSDDTTQVDNGNGTGNTDNPTDDTPADDTPTGKDVIRLGTSMNDPDADILPYGVTYNKIFYPWTDYTFTEVYFQDSAKFEDGKSYYFEAPDDGNYYAVDLSSELNNVNITVVNARLSVVAVENSTVTVTVPMHPNGNFPYPPFNGNTSNADGGCVPVFSSNGVSGTTLNLPHNSRMSIHGNISTVK